MTVLVLTQADNGKSMALQLGDKVTVRLPEAPTAGFRWAIDQGNAETPELVDSTYVPAPGATTGGAGQRTLKFAVNHGGTVRLSLKLWREWEGDRSVSARFDVTLQVGN